MTFRLSGAYKIILFTQLNRIKNTKTRLNSSTVLHAFTQRHKSKKFLEFFFGFSDDYVINLPLFIMSIWVNYTYFVNCKNSYFTNHCLLGSWQDWPPSLGLVWSLINNLLTSSTTPYFDHRSSHDYVSWFRIENWNPA